MNFKNIKLKTIFIILTGYLLAFNVICAQVKKSVSTDKKYSIFNGTLVDLTWPEVKKAAEDNALVLLPVGVIEEHGPHMCLGTDTYEAYQRCFVLKQKLDSMHIKAVIAPPVYWGIMVRNETGAFPGSFTVNPATMKALLTDVFENLKIWGFHKIYCINHHGDRLHRKTLSEAITDAKEKFGLVFYNDQEEKDRDNGPDFNKYVKGKVYEPDYHAGCSETAEMLEFYPSLVKVDIAKTLKPENTFQPLGYAGDPANYAALNASAFFDAEVSYNAICIDKWLKKPEAK